jgi:hypothetical protein
MKLLILSVVVMVVALFGVSAVGVWAEPDPSSFTIEYPEFVEDSHQKPAEFVQNFYLYALSISGTLAVVMIVFGGVKYVASAGNVSARTDALDIIKSAVWGIVLLGGAYLILNTIDPQLTQLKDPTLGPIPAIPTSTPESALPINISYVIDVSDELVVGNNKFISINGNHV